MNQLETELKGLAEAEFDRLVATYPGEKELLRPLRTMVLAGISQHCSNVDALGEFIDSIQDEGGSLGVSGYVYSDLFDFQDALRKRICEALTKDSGSFPELTVQLKATPKTKARQTGKAAKKGERTKLGGKPDWIQCDETPICKHCQQQPMTFVGQVDSVGAAETPLGRSLGKAEAFMFADSGMIYVFWCRGCNETRSVLQCY